ncbi:flap endonuclease [Rhodococcus rhodnii]|uniref:5'-3' exonuclease n=2 Tax=Rhodococcus rhodnii TaxID=38312 RepID=R7WSZ5_9NOCA|nr:5'-3' exonuclease H3TH domain-containing protein [Rhodococcus rhodnii]EOM78363.1 5'-3' exonuclease [Rhodococcus rhodnii LMG 5362]TXG91194.1 flap endonuclease [Rhodococcus rhodnii]
MSAHPDGRPLVLLDGASLWFRAFHAMPDSLRSPGGEPIGAVRGFLDMVTSLVTRLEPHRLVVCLDVAWRPRFRVAAVPSYKEHRVLAGTDGLVEEVPPTLPPQVEHIMAALAAAGIATAGAPDCEADDVLGTLAAHEDRDTTVVVSGDRDLLQVVTDRPLPVRVLYVGRGLAKAELMGPTEVAAKYGIPAERAGETYAELALLRGDPSDGLPGVTGVGDKTAAGLLSTYGSLDTLRAAVADPESPLAKGQRAKLTAAADYLDAALPVVRVRRDAPVSMSGPDTLPAAPAEPDALTALAAELGIESTVTRLVKALAAYGE